MNKINLFLVAAVILSLGVACQKAPDRKNGNQAEGGAAGKPTPPIDQAVEKTKTTCERKATYTTVKDGVTTKTLLEVHFIIESAQKEIGNNQTEADSKMVYNHKWFEVSDDGTKTEKSSTNTIYIENTISTIERLELNIYLSKEHSKGTTTYFNQKTQKNEIETFDIKHERKYYFDGEMSYDITRTENGVDTLQHDGRFKVTKKSEQDGRVEMRTRTLMAAVKVKTANNTGERTMDTSVQTCREEKVDSVDLAPPAVTP